MYVTLSAMPWRNVLANFEHEIVCAVQTAPRKTPVVAWLLSASTGKFCGLCDGYGVGVGVRNGGPGVGVDLSDPPLGAGVGVGAAVGLEFGMMPLPPGSAPPAAPPPPPPQAASMEIAKNAAIDEKARVPLRPVTGTESPSPQRVLRQIKSRVTVALQEFGSLFDSWRR